MVRGRREVCRFSNAQVSSEVEVKSMKIIEYLTLPPAEDGLYNSPTLDQ
jgi:hypothetical protein